MLGVQTSQELPFRLTMFAPRVVATVPNVNLKLSLFPAGGLIRYRNVLFGATLTLVMIVGGMAIWFTTTLKDMLAELFVGCPSVTVTVILAKPNVLVMGAKFKTAVLSGLE